MPSSAVPRIDLHRHLDGNLRLKTCLELARKHRVLLPKDDLAALKPHLQMVEPGPDLATLLEKVERMASVLGDVDACRRVAYENVEDAARERLHYVELRFSPAFMASAHDLPLEAVVEAVVDGVAAGREDAPVQVQLIGILSRTFGPDSAKRELESLLSHKDAIAALDLAGDEARFSGEAFVDHFRRGREAGWAITVHAGEARGAESVWQALRELGADRIGHATQPSKMIHSSTSWWIGASGSNLASLATFKRVRSRATRATRFVNFSTVAARHLSTIS